MRGAENVCGECVLCGLCERVHDCRVQPRLSPPFPSLSHSGFFINPANMHIVYRWIFDISFTSWGVQAAVYNELHGLEITCTAAETAAGCTGSGDALLETLGFAGTDPWRLCGLLLVQVVLWRVLALLALHFMYTGQSFRERLRSLCH